MRLEEILLFALLIAMVPILIGNYSYGIRDQIEHLPLVFRTMESSYLANDFYVNANSRFSPRTYFVRFIAALARLFPLPILYLLLLCFARTLTVLVTYSVSMELFKGSNLAGMLAAALVMAVDSTGFGVVWHLNSDYLLPPFLALPFGLASLWMGIKNRPFVCAGLSMASALIHPLVGLEPGAVGLMTALISALSRPQRRLKNIVMVVIAFIAMGIFTLYIWIIPYYKNNVSIGINEFVGITAYFRGSDSSIISAYPIEDYISLICFLAAFAISWRWWRASLQKSEAASYPYRILIAVGIVLCLCVMGYIFVEVFPTRLWVVAMAPRLLFAVKWLGFIVIGGTAARMLTEGKTFDQSYPAWLLLAGSGWIQPVIMFFSHLIEISRRYIKSLIPSTVFHLWLGMTFLVGVVGLIKYGSVKESFIMALVIAISLWFLLIPKRWYRAFIPFLGLLVLAALVRSPIERANDAIEPAIKDISNYVRRSTSADAVFLTPPDFGIFRLTAKRAIVVDFKCVPFQDIFIKEWRERLWECYGDVKKSDTAAAREMDRLYVSITDEKISYIAKKYKASHAVLYKETPSDFPVLFQNDTYKIIEIRKGYL